MSRLTPQQTLARTVRELDEQSPFHNQYVPNRDDNLRPVPHQEVGFTKTDLLLWIATAAAGTAVLFALAIALSTAQRGTP